MLQADKRIHMILVTGGAGFIGANFILDWRGSAPAPEDLTALVFSVGGSR